MPDTDGGESWGRIVTINGVRQRVAEDDAAAEVVDDELDLTLDEPEKLEGWVYAVLDEMAYRDMVREGMRLWVVSVWTVNRRIADAVTDLATTAPHLAMADRDNRPLGGAFRRIRR